MRSKSCRTIALVFSLLSGCSGLLGPGLATPLPTEYLPTAIALTLAARGVPLLTPTVPLPATPTSTPLVLPTAAPPSNTPLPTDTPVPPPTLPLTVTLSDLTPTLFSAGFLETPTSTPLPTIPEARVQIVRLGELSLVTSPIEFTVRLTSRYGKVVRVDLYGEDGRLLAREVKTYNTVPWTRAVFSSKLDFEISAAAEAGRLVVSVEDPYGRIFDVNSINLILLSKGITELTPPSGMDEIIVIQDPQPKTLITGGTLYVSGLVRPSSDQPLNVVLITQDGQVVGQRLASVSIPIPGVHGTFFAEVHYTVTDLTPALLVVYENGGIISEYAHLSSIDVILSP